MQLNANPILIVTVSCLLIECLELLESRVNGTSNMTSSAERKAVDFYKGCADSGECQCAKSTADKLCTQLSNPHSDFDANRYMIC